MLVTQVGQASVFLTYQLLSDLNSIRWHKQGTMKLRLAQARDPTKEMNRPKPGTEIATTAISRTRHVLTAANMRLLDLAPNLAIKLACAKQCFSSQAMHLTPLLVPTGARDALQRSNTGKPQLLIMNREQYPLAKTQ